MNSIHMKAGFITPEKKIEVDSEHLLAFCGLVCQKHLKEHPEEMKNWNEFIKNYIYFHPFFDFVVFYLKWIPVGIFGDSDLFGILDGEKLYIQHLPETIEEDDLYSTLFYTQIQKLDGKNYMVKADNHTLGIINANDYIQGEGLVLQDGKVFLSKEVHQFAIARTILNQILIMHPSVAMDCKACKPTYKDDYHWYLIDRLGAILFTEEYAIYDKDLISEKQKEILEHISVDKEEQKAVQDEYENPYDLERTKDIIYKIYAK